MSFAGEGVGGEVEIYYESMDLGLFDVCFNLWHFLSLSTLKLSLVCPWGAASKLAAGSFQHVTILQ